MTTDHPNATPLQTPAPAVVLVVMGVSGCGKTTLARQLAEHLNWQFLDADDFHSHANKAHMRSGKPLTDEMRRPWVESIRQRLIAQAKQGNSCTLAFSGLRKAHRNALRIEDARVIYLHLRGEKEIILQRMNGRSEHFMPSSLVDSQFAALELPTPEEQIYTLDINNSVEALINKSLNIINNTSTAITPV